MIADDAASEDAVHYQIVQSNNQISEKAVESRKKRRKADKNSLFSIGFKLVSIVTLIVIISLGSITALVSWLVRQDLQISAEDANFETNRRSASEAEETLAKMRSDTLIFTHTISLLDDDNHRYNSSEYFFKQNQRIAAVSFSASGEDFLFTNEHFFITHDINSALVRFFLENQTATLRRAGAGETTVINAAPHFTVHLLAMFFPGDTRNSSMVILFSPENLNTSFGTGVNRSWMINSAGDVLIHSDFENIKNAVNVSDRQFIRDIQESAQKSRQALIETDFGITKVKAVNTWETIKEKALSVFDYCADFICGVLNIKNNISYNRETDMLRQFMAYTKLNTGGCTVITSIEYDKVFEGIKATTRRNIYLTIAILAFSIMLIWFFSKSISIPLKILAAAARKIEGGEFDIDLKQKGDRGTRRDEIGVLTASFQKMTSALHIFGRFTNKEIALKAMRNQIKPGGLPKHATVFFSDIRGFTAKSETFANIFGDDSSNRIIHWLNEYFTEMIDCVERTNGTIDKFIGDAVMAHWGTAYTTGSPAKDAIACVRAALMMRKALYELNKNRRKGDLSDPPITIGCGINTGVVTAGQLGSDQRMEYTVIGDSVNLASRIESLTKPLGADILISESTYKFVKKYFTTEEMPSVTVKGKEKPVRIFAVIGHVNADKGPKTLAGVRKLLGIETPNLENVDINADEKKYKIGSEKKKNDD